MQKLEKVFLRFFKTNNNAFKLTPSSLRLFSIDKSTTSETLHEKELQKDVEEKHNISQLEIDTEPKDQSKKTFAKYTTNKAKDDIEETSFASLLRHSNLMHVRFCMINFCKSEI